MVKREAHRFGKGEVVGRQKPSLESGAEANVMAFGGLYFFLGTELEIFWRTSQSRKIWQSDEQGLDSAQA